MKEALKHNTTCRICDSSDLVQILDLGKMPPANSFLKKEELGKQESKFPLVIYFCRNCCLLQLLDIVDPAILFGEYDYMTSASEPLVLHFVKMAEDLADRFNLKQEDLVVEIGGNDGSLLAVLKGRARLLNIDPARNVAEISRKNGVETLNDFFSSEIARNVLEKYGSAKLVIANNVMAHIDNIRDVFKGIQTLVGSNGVFVFEVHWVGNLISDGGFDQIYHEHLCYHSLHDLNYLAKEFGLRVFDVQTVPIHGECLRVFVAKDAVVQESVKSILAREEVLGLTKAETFLKFGERVQKGKEKLRAMLSDIKKQGKRVAGYGAPAKGNTLLNFYGINTTLVDYVTDTTPLKQGMYTPGTKIPVLHPSAAIEQKPDYFLLLAWNYADAIMKKEEEFIKNGGKFIIPVPDPKIV